MTPVRFSVPIADEQLGLLDADLVVMFPIGRTAQDIEQNPLFRSVRPCRRGMRSSSTRYALDTVVPMLAAAVRT